MIRVQGIIIRDGKILMARHRHGGREYWCLPGGGIDPGERPEEALLRELWEECRVMGKILRQVSAAEEPRGGRLVTYHVDIQDQEPQLGYDPEFEADGQLLIGIQWLALNEICERDRAFLFASGLLAIGDFYDEVAQWGDDVSYPRRADDRQD
jgi:ADP-ribose pyrophosphatase YjhB (NUDIX family)